MAMLPRAGVSSPATARSSVDLPLPERPSSATISPSAMSAEIPLSTSFEPRRTCTSLTRRLAMLQSFSEQSDEKKPAADDGDVHGRQRHHDVDASRGPQGHEQ